MMKFLRNNLSIIALAVVAIAVPLHFSHAGVFGLAGDLFEGGIAWLMNLLVTAMSLLVALAGFLLNVSMQFTLNIKDFVDNTPAIFTTWKAIRDISGMFMIFFLLYASFQMILGLGNKFGQHIKNIIIAGVLINFSFFIASLGIDVSNIVSLQLYSAIAPANSINGTQAPGSFSNGQWTRAMDGGLSDIIMNSLRIQTISDKLKLAPGDSTASAVASGITAPIKIFLTGVIAVIIELMAAMSFAAAALAFIIRTIILVFLLAFSPIWYAAFMIPELKEYSKKWSGYYYNMLVFMPVYLLLMYLALSTLSAGPIFATSGSYAAGGAWYKDFVVLGINAALIVVMMNIPLLAAASIAGSSIGLIKKASENWGAAAIWSKVGSRTAGRAAYSLANSNFMARQMAASPAIGGALQSSIASVAKSGFGQKKGSYEDILKAKKDAEEKVHKAIGSLDETKYDNTDKTKKARTITNDQGKQETKEMNEREYEKYKRSQLQSDYRKNLPWKASASTLGLGGVIGFMVDNRGNRQTQAKLDKEAGKEKDKKAKGEAEKTKDNVQKEVDKIDGQIEKLKRQKDDPGLYMADKIALDQKIEELEKEKDGHKENIAKLNAIIKKGSEAESEDEKKATKDALDEIKKGLPKPE